ncbi:MAG: hypothetical protein WCX73_02765 [Candidatus Pacearchaeota archaeon]|jgi:hypothetical protein
MNSKTKNTQDTLEKIADSKTKKPKPYHWASRGNFQIQSSDAQTIAFCQQLEQQGYGLRSELGLGEKVDPSYAVIFPDGKVVELDQLENFSKNFKGPIKSNYHKTMLNASIYLQAYEQI